MKASIKKRLSVGVAEKWKIPREKRGFLFFRSGWGGFSWSFWRNLLILCLDNVYTSSIFEDFLLKIKELLKMYEKAGT